MEEVRNSMGTRENRSLNLAGEVRLGWVGAAVALLLVAGPAAAQKDYYNLDKNRPVRIEDAYATERYALEVKVAPLRLERERGGVYHWGFDPEIAYGILPRTSVEVGFPFAIVDGGEETARTSGLSGIELSLFHNLNIETRTFPALAIRGDLVFPVGSLAGDQIYPSVTGIATRSYSWARIHANAQYTFGSAPDDVAGEAGATPHETSRWLAGVAVDRVFPLSAFLLIADVYASQPLHADDPVEWNAGTGIRYQVSPFLAVDAGVGRRLTGDTGWYFTLGSAYHMGLRALMPRIR
ncbi:hypothetical protein BH23GEM6_BH23GEM6_13180 [soil metagenome]